jgi:muramidase (phage lysozyme)
VSFSVVGQALQRLGLELENLKEAVLTPSLVQGKIHDSVDLCLRIWVSLSPPGTSSYAKVPEKDLGRTYWFDRDENNW